MFKVYHCNIQKTESCIFFPLSSDEQPNDIIVDKFLWRNSTLMKSVLLITLKNRNETTLTFSKVEKAKI